MKLASLFILVFALFIGTAKAQDNSTTGADGFPDHWWQPVPADQLPGWEIPPQSADRNKGEVILSKRNELGQFSNLGATPFVLDGDSYASVEALWQGMKYPEGPGDERLKDPSVVWKRTRQDVMGLAGFDAKAAGNEANVNLKKLGIRWITYQGKKLDWTGADLQAHYDIIYRACRAKLDQNPKLKQLLLSTKNLKLLPDHNEYNGAPPVYFYAEIFTKLRAELQAEP
ncbi:MAG: NADAR family protein [Pseudobdellovibrio sp.]